MRAKAAFIVPLLVGAFIGQALMQQKVVYPFWKKYYAPRKDSDLSSLDPDQMLFALAGFREMIAGLLWVRADAYFDEGNYDAILPMVRIVTMLDPKQIDVYATGMWHIAYNFTDEAHRSDRRYIAPAIALGKEGSRLNDYTYELWFETGWIWYHKVDDDYAQAVKYFERANEYRYEELLAEYRDAGIGELEANWRAELNAIPIARRNLLAQAYLRNGQVHSAVDLLYAFLKEAESKMGDEPMSPQRINRDTVEGNLDNLLVRMAQRGSFARERGDALTGYDVEPPFDIGFSASVTVLEPKILLVEGTWGVIPLGTRIRFIFRDADYKDAVPGGMVWDKGDDVTFEVDPNETFLQDQLFVRSQRFSRKVDMSRDVTMYPLRKDKYVIEFYYNPRSAPPHIQDKFGFNGEGMTDKNYLSTDAREGQRVIFCRLEIPKEMVLMTGEYRRGRSPAIVKTPNYDPRSALGVGGEAIQVPGLRTETQPQQ